MEISRDRTIGIKDMLVKQNLSENDLLIIQDDENTKKTTLKYLVMSMVKDDSLPAEFRLYSSKKVIEAIDEATKGLTDKLGLVENNITKINNIMATIEKLNSLKEELVKVIGDKLDSSSFEEAMKSVRQTGTKITSDDLDTSADSKKIKLVNLAEEVIAAMTGDTIVIPTNKAPIGGWVTEDFADESVMFNKLAKDYRYGGNIIDGNINDITKDGIYILGSDIIGMPKSDIEDGDCSRILDVKNIGNNFIIQTLYYPDDLKNYPIYRRKGKVTSLHVLNFVETHEINTTYKVTHNMLNADFSNGGKIKSGNIFSIREEGSYIATSSVTNLPTKEDYIVTVTKHDTEYLYEARLIDTNSCHIYVAKVYFTSGLMPVNTQWYEISTTKKSKFDGSNVYLFGDGILFGFGSDDYVNKSIPALLSNDYGMNIENRSLGDATYGNYDDDTLAKSSVLTQIKTTDLSNADYVIILAGTHDWESGKATIGKATALNDFTFKGAISQAISDIMYKNAKTKILICTPLFRSRISSGDNKDSDTYTVNDRHMIEYVDAVIETCQNNHVPVLDLYRTGMINKYNSSIYLKDGLYLNDTGNRMITDKIVDAMNMYY